MPELVLPPVEVTYEYKVYRDIASDTLRIEVVGRDMRFASEGSIMIANTQDMRHIGMMIMAIANHIDAREDK